MEGPDSAPAVGGGAVIVGSTGLLAGFDVTTAAFHVDTQTERWRHDIDAYAVSSPVLDGGTLNCVAWKGSGGYPLSST